jgi:hypothetical protein
MPEGRSVFEVPPNIIRGRLDEAENVGNEDLDSLSEVVEEPTSRKHRHQHSSSRTIHHTSQEEQADEAVFRINNHPLKSDATSSTSVSADGKPTRTSHRTGHHPSANHRPTSSPVPTLATLEDHDLFRETAEEEGETAGVEADESRHVLRPSNIFMHRIMQHHQEQQYHSKAGHYSRARENRKQ